MKIELDFNDKQREAWKLLKDRETNIILFGGAGNSGKSWLGSLWLIINCIKYPNSRWAMCRSSLIGIKTKLLKTFHKCAKAHGLKLNTHYTVNNQYNYIKFFNGSEIQMIDLAYKPSDPDGDFLGGLEISGALIDELPEIQENYFETLFTRCRDNLDKFDIVPKLLCTCNPSQSWVKSYFYDRYLNDTLPKNTKFINAAGAVNKFWDEAYQTVIRTYSPRQYKRLVTGDWNYVDEVDQLFKSEKIDNIFEKFETRKQDYTNKFVDDYYISADIARFGEDSTVIVVWNSFTIINIVKLDKSSITNTANKIKELSSQYKIPNNKIIVDSDGLGAAVPDILHCTAFNNGKKALKGERFDNIKSQMYFKMATTKWNVSDSISTDYKDSIRRELTAIRDESNDVIYKINKKDEQKKMLGKSPDFTDAIMLRFYYTYVSNTLRIDFV